MKDMIGAFLVLFGFGMLMAAGGDPVMDTPNVSAWTLVLYAAGGFTLIGLGCAICGRNQTSQYIRRI